MLVTQTNTQQGPLPFPCGEDLTGKAGFLVKANRNAGGKFAPLLPTAVTDITLFIVDEENTIGKDGTFIPLSHGDQVRIKAKGVGQAGDKLALADTGTAADKGKVRKQLATTGTWHLVAIAEEDFVDGQLVLCRVAQREATVVP